MEVNVVTKGAALNQFFAGFGIPVYVVTSIPDNAEMPYLTYDYNVSSFDFGEVAIVVNLWYYTDSEAIPNKKADEISEALGFSGALLKCDDGYIWLKRGSPFCQAVADDVSATIKRRYINISAEYLTKK